MPTTFIHIFYSYIDPNNHSYFLEHFFPTFPKEYQNRIGKYKRWEDVQLSLLGRMLLRYGCRKIDGFSSEKAISYTQYKKPYFENSNLKFNISHSGGIVVCAITKCIDMGIDIEAIFNVRIENFKFQMTRNEWQRISMSDNRRFSFFEYWTQKEAVLKAHGKGFSTPLQSFEITDGQSTVEGKNYFLTEVKINNNYKCHIAVKENCDFLILEKQQLDFSLPFYKNLNAQAHP